MTARLLRLSSFDSCRPRWTTQRRTDWPTYGGRAALIAEHLGLPFMPWQREVADIALEVDPATGRLAYREVVLTVPRQSGKTTLILAIAVQRALGFGGRQNIVYTAQTRIDARKKWEDEHLPILKSSEAIGPLFRARKTTGNEAFIWQNGSSHGLVSATRKSGHGPFLDEAFAHEDDRLEQAFRPSMITRPEPQSWIVSTAGTEASTYLRGKVIAARTRLDADTSTTTASVEYSAPDDADPEDPATWWGCMPALGRTVTEAVIRAELASMLDEHGLAGLSLFRRAYLNQWPDAAPQRWLVIPESAWTARRGAQGQPDGPVAFALSAAWPDAEMGSIAVVGQHRGEVYAQIVEHRPGTSWMPVRMRELQDRHHPVATILDDKDPAAREKAALVKAGVELTPLTMQQAGQAYGMTIAAVTGDAPYLRHYDQTELNTAVAAATKRPVGDAHTWARRGPDDTSPIVAVTDALYGLATNKPMTPFALLG